MFPPNIYPPPPSPDHPHPTPNHPCFFRPLQYLVDCSTINSLPTISITIGGQAFSLTGAEYTLNVENLGVECLLAMVGIDIPAPAGEPAQQLWRNNCAIGCGIFLTRFPCSTAPPYLCRPPGDPRRPVPAQVLLCLRYRPAARRPRPRAVRRKGQKCYV